VTISEIKEHPWYKMNLPLYLKEIYLYTNIWVAAKKGESASGELDYEIL
jgi:hypothetical protein